MDKPNFNNEKSTESQLWLPHVKPRPTRTADFFTEITAPAGRYLSPLSQYDKLSFLLKQKIAAISEADGGLSFENSLDSVPLRWQIIVNFLYEAGVTSSPKFTFGNHFNDEPKIYNTSLSSGPVKNLTDGNTNLENIYSGGASQNIDEALSKTVGEILERYILTIYRNSELVKASIDDLQNKNIDFLNPLLTASFSEEQKQKFPRRDFDNQSVFQWAEGKSLMTGKHALIPAQMVFWNYRCVPNEPYTQEPITNGAGGMFTLTEAILSGLYELIQRDAFLIYWLNKIAPRRVSHDSLKNPEIKKLLRDSKRYNIQVEILDITSDLGVPVFSVVLLDNSGKGPMVSVAASCHSNPERAATQAIAEAIAVRHWQRRQMESPCPDLPSSYEPFSLPLGRLDRLRLWADPKMKNMIDFFISRPIVSIEECYPNLKAVANPSDELSQITELFSRRGKEYEIFYYEAKHPALEVLGYHVVKVNVPAIVPLYLHETDAPLGAKRIRLACENLGYRPLKELNPIPHPFP